MPTVKFMYLGETYEVDRKVYLNCVEKSLVNRLFSFTSMGKRDNYFFIMSDDDRWFCAHSTKPKYYKKFQDASKHLAIGNLTKEQCRYLEKLTRSCSDFRHAITVTRQAVETIVEIS